MGCHLQSRHKLVRSTSVLGRDDFTTEDEARDYIIGAAKKWIDDNQG
jgi:hypothetical protein